MRYKVIVILHVSSFLYSDKVLHRIETFPAAGTCEKFLDSHGVPKEDRDELRN